MNLPSQPPVDRLHWFAGDRDALALYERLVFVAHAWDDLIDKDKPVDVNTLMVNLLLYLPCNPCYERFAGELRALFLVSITSYMASNLMEKSGDAHRLELAHYLRYGVVSVAVFLIAALNGVDRAAQILVDAAPVLVPERLADYLTEHQHAKVDPA
jgi:hypothetical protein